MTLQSLFDQAVALHQQGRFVEAESRYLEIVSAHPGLYQAQYLLALLRVQQQRFLEAEPAIEAALKINPEAPEALALQGQLRKAAGRQEEALASFDRAVTLKPDHVEAWFMRGVILLGLEHFGAALESFDRTLALRPGAAEAWNNRGAALHGLGRFDDEVASYDRALAINPDYAQGWSNRGFALHKLRRFEDALASYEKALAIRPAYADAWTRYAVSLQSLERHDKALAAANKALALEPDHGDALFARAEILCQSNRIQDGFADFRRHAQLWGQRETLPLPAHQQRHHAQQRAWLAQQGVKAEAFHIEGGEKLPGAAVNSANAEDIAAQWAARQPQIVVVDNLLTQEALEELRRFCWGSTVWSRAYEDGYLGAMPASGFACPLIAQIAEELRSTFAGVLGEDSLHMFWGFNYDSTLSGTAMHADEAAVNVNFWITPDEANLDPNSGGLVVWDKAAPPDWDFVKFNSDRKAIRDFLEQAGAKAITIPYRSNRAVIFDSDLFHKTDVIRFKDGYTNRRINLTMLYGKRVGATR